MDFHTENINYWKEQLKKSDDKDYKNLCKQQIKNFENSKSISYYGKGD